MSCRVVEGSKPNEVSDFDGVLVKWLRAWTLKLDWFSVLALPHFSCVTLGVLYNLLASKFFKKIFYRDIICK